MQKEKITIKTILEAFFIACLFSSSLYLEYFSYFNIYINSFTSILAIYFIINSSRTRLFFIGFFIGILWFYWISFSFIYYDLKYLVPIIILFFGLFYGLVFYLLGIINSIYIKALLFFALSYFAPFTFNWLQVEILFVNSIFSISKESLALIILSLVLISKFKKFYKVLFIIPLFFALDKQDINSKELDLKVFMPEINISQEKKWEKDSLEDILALNNRLIVNAIEHEYDLIILPETSYPLVLNKQDNIQDYLLKKSYDIDIIVGSLNKVGKQYYNSTYHFSKGKLTIANKVVLVPFGESVPFPEKIAELINDIFYDGAEDFLTASKATDFEIKGTKFRNAICYEATTNKIFEDLGDTKFMIASSNNAWFTPSIEPILQKQLLRYFAKKYQITIYHSVNGSENYIIKP